MTRDALLDAVPSDRWRNTGRIHEKVAPGQVGNARRAGRRDTYRRLLALEAAGLIERQRLSGTHTQWRRKR